MYQTVKRHIKSLCNLSGGFGRRKEGGMSRIGFEAISDLKLKAATDGCMIAYHRKQDNQQLSVPPSDWSALQAGGEEADGVLVFVDGRSPIIVAPTYTSLPWSKNNVAVDIDKGYDMVAIYEDLNGKSKTEEIFKRADELFGSEEEAKNYAAGWCKAYSKGGIGEGNWWLPSFGELMIIRENLFGINKCLSLINGAQEIPSGSHWSSTENVYTRAWGMWMSNGHIFYTNKTAQLYVRPLASYY